MNLWDEIEASLFFFEILIFWNFLFFWNFFVQAPGLIRSVFLFGFVDASSSSCGFNNIYSHDAGERHCAELILFF